MIRAPMTEATPRPRCYRCLRPQTMCLCGDLPVVPTRTQLLILQHPKERVHALGTARIVRLSLPNARLVVARSDFTGNLLTEVDVPDDAAVLFPHADAVDLETLPVAERPRTLVVLDGTWAHARRLYKHNPWLHRLRHVRLHPRAPSNYRIRKEPKADYVSTVEAIVAALHLLEPETPGLDGLLVAFDRMIDRQIDKLETAQRHGRRKRPRLRPSRSLPAVLSAPGLVAVYAESSLPGGVESAARELVQWVAVRVDTGEVQELLLRPHGEGPTATHLQHMRITAAMLANGVDLATARARFHAFAGPAPAVVSWTDGSLRWGRELGGLLGADATATTLKAAYANLRQRRPSYLETVVEREGLAAPPVACAGRAAERLGSALALARLLRAERAKLVAAGAV